MTVDINAGDPALTFAATEQTLLGVRDYIIDHHSGAWEKDFEQIRRYHLSLGWREVGYNYGIEYAGQLRVGRPLTLPGAHCSQEGMNLRSIGIVLLGNFEEPGAKPTDQQLETLRRLTLELRRKHPIPAKNVLGHGQVKGAATACPGKAFPREAYLPPHLRVDGKIQTAPMRLIKERSHVYHLGMWEPATSMISALGGTYRWRGEENCLEVEF